MLLATDLDGCFLAGDANKRLELYQLIAVHPASELVFVTGRGLDLVMPLFADPAIPRPSYIICDVGTTVVDGANLLPVEPLQSRIDARWPGDCAIEQVVAGFPGIQRQDVQQQRRCSYFCEASAVTQKLEVAALSAGCDLLFSGNRFLDFLPRGVNKGSTLSHLTRHLGIDPEKVLVAGDSLNDLSLFQTDFHGVCVGNSEAGLLQATRRNERVYHAIEPGCGGILEALSHFNLLSACG